MPGRGCLPWSPEGAVSEDWSGGQPAPGPRRCLQGVEESLHLPVPVHPLIYLEKKGPSPSVIANGPLDLDTLQCPPLNPKAEPGQGRLQWL